MDRKEGNLLLAPISLAIISQSMKRSYLFYESNMNKIAPKLPSRQAGFNLIEIMIALALGLVMMVGLASMFVQMQKTFSEVNKLSEVQNNQRAALHFLRNAIYAAGYDPNPSNESVTSNFGTTPPLIGSVLKPTDTTVVDTFSLTSTNIHNLTISFIADGTNAAAYHGCTSAQLNSGDIYSDTYSYAIDGGVGYLKCVETNVATGIASDPIYLISNVYGLSFLYGIDVLGSGSISQYLTADNINADDWQKVKAVTIKILFLNPFTKYQGKSALNKIMENVALKNR